MPATINRTMTPTEWALLVSLATIWGGSFFFNAIAVQALPAFTIVAARLAGAAILLFLTVRVTGATMPTTLAVWGAFAVMGLLNNLVPFSLIVWSQGHIASGLASILNATTPLFTVVVAHFFTRDEKMTALRVLGLVIGFVGVVVMIGADVLRAPGHLVAELAVLGASLSYACSAVFARRFARLGQPPLVTATGQFVAAAFLTVPLALLVDRPWTLAVPGAEVWGALLGLAALTSYIAYLIYYRILATAGAVNLMLVTFLVPVSAILLGTLILGERLAANHFLGMGLIGLGLAAIDGRPVAFLRARFSVG